MIRIIDLDIEGTITGDTKVTEIALVEMPAIEQNFIYFTKQQFIDSIKDYPQYITDTAIRARKWVDENGYGSCLTPVGKSRLNQLANREPVSIETLKRMKAFGSRHKTDWDSSKSFDEGCGYLALASWGFEPSTYDSVMNYLERVITKEEMAEIGPRGGVKESPKAPKSNTPNKNPKGEGSAKGDASTTRGAQVSKRVEETLQNKSDDFNEKYKDKLGYGVNLGMLKSVYQRGVGAYNVSHSPAVKSAEQWALARVNAFLYLVKNGRPENPKYDSDYDLLPTKHPKKQENMEYEPSLPPYVGYATGDTKNDMLIEPVLFVKRQPGEDRSEYINRCTEYLIKNEGKQPDQAYAICNSEADEYSIGQKVSFDFDGTLNTPRGRGLALYELQSGSDVYIISARADKRRMMGVADELGIPEDKVFATGSNRAKIQKIKDLKITKHYDNNEDVISQLGRVGIQFMCPCLDEFVMIIEPLQETIYTPPNALFSESNLDVYGYRTKYFQICPGAQATFKELTSYPNDDDTIGMIRSAAVVADSIFKIEDDVLKASNATESQLSEATVLVDDFKDIINEIQKIQGKTYDVSYMDNHIRTIASYVKGNKQNFTMIGFIDGEPVFTTPEEAEMYGEKQHGCSGHHTHTDEDGNVVYMGCEVHPEKMLNIVADNVDILSVGQENIEAFSHYSEEEKEVVKLLKFLKDTDYEQFEAVVGSMRGATEAEIKRRNHKTPTIYFKYERVLSGFPDRDFCSSIENRYFRRLEIDLLRDTNTEFGHERQPYSKWLYKGGPNCVHAWRRYLVQGNVVADQGMADGTAGIPPKQLPNNGYYSPETKRKSEVAYIISQQNMSKQEFSVDDEKRMVYSPLMIPNILIPRLDEDTNEKYFVKFTPSVIEKIQNLYMIEKRLDQTNYEHTDRKIESVVMVESWLVSGESDKAYQLGFNRSDIPDGTWMGGFKVLDTPEGDNIWKNYIKTGRVKGFSVEGNFLMNFSRLKTDEYLLDEIINIIKQITD